MMAGTLKKQKAQKKCVIKLKILKGIFSKNPNSK